MKILKCFKSRKKSHNVVNFLKVWLKEHKYKKKPQIHFQSRRLCQRVSVWWNETSQLSQKHIFLIVRFRRRKKQATTTKSRKCEQKRNRNCSDLLFKFSALHRFLFLCIFWRVWLSLMYLWYLLVHVVKRMVTPSFHISTPSHVLMTFFSQKNTLKCLWPFTRKK